MTIHTVRQGDTVWKIANMYQVPISTIMQVNGLMSGALVPGLHLYIPDNRLPERFYQVKAGDTLSQLAETFASTVPLILAANPGIAPNELPVGGHLVIPTNQRYTMQTLVFMDAYAGTPYTEKLRELAGSITYLAVFTYSFTRAGDLIEAEDEEILAACRENNIRPLMVMSNYEENNFSAELAAAILHAEPRTVLINNIAETIEEKGYAGVSIDFEFVPPERRQDFTAFLKELKQKLGSRILQINAHAKTDDFPENRLTGFLDYAAIGEIADITAVMTIDYGYAAGPPDPIAPIWWVEEVLNYATSQISSRKLMMAMSLYGYDWTLPVQAETNAEMISVLDAQNRAIASGVPIQYDERAQSPHYRYRRGQAEHAVFFEDIQSVRAKYQLLQEYNLLGTTYWRLRFSFPQNWAYVERNIQAEK
ncbi:glycosyl hydrolase family 18 protein [Bacillus thermotolerans]|uniref:glycosyl hydrolase family 18 protein n=1 Tax=Bacillus thermotolerans TaxID=1221996 RepID=UPI00057DCF01|nr:LysM peptidoglycan-binding domain-containing protein [Bacillus thermotolerans]KKB33421.1 hypothetical protein QY97_03307 [Bacillus thermotolerans]